MAYTTINKSTDYFNTKLYTGTGTSHNITGVGFQPDWVWVKNRDIGTDAHTTYDAVRGATKRLQISSNGAESTKTNGLTAFGSDGYTAGSASAINANGSNLVSWNWKAGGGQGSSNTDGTINTTYTSVNTTAGFSICSYTGTGSNATIGHGLGAVPKMIIVKNRDGTQGWAVYHHNLPTGSAGQGSFLSLNTTDSYSDSSTFWNSTAPTNSVFSIGTSGWVNNNSETYIAYCFAEKTGYSKFGSYTGNGSSSSSPFIYTGFKPSWVMIKNVSTSNDWYLFDNFRDTLSPNNPVGRKSLYANTTGAEITRTTKDMDFLSNGIKLRTADGSQNNNNENYIYMAFGQSLVGSNNVPATAR